MKEERECVCECVSEVSKGGQGLWFYLVAVTVLLLLVAGCWFASTLTGFGLGTMTVLTISRYVGGRREGKRSKEEHVRKDCNEQKSNSTLQSQFKK